MKTMVSLLILVFFVQAKGDMSCWSKEKAKEWYCQQPWLIGCNYISSTAINQLEMWQEETFDIETIDKELGWAEDIGINVVRVYLHDLLWNQDSEGFLKRVDHFLAIADKHKIKVMFVLLDSVWNPFPEIGKQPEPTPHLHNSGWVQSPHIDLLKDTSRHDELEPYIKGLLERFKHDKRILLWDMYNEPDNNNSGSYKKHEPENKTELALMLLNKLFEWAREVDPDQPLSVGLRKGDWREDKLDALNRFALENSDIITYHNYESFTSMKEKTKLLMKYSRPLICTEYMSRPMGNTFMYMLPFFEKHKIGAINWGFVSGKSQTIYPWDSWNKKYTAEPKLWFHDIFRADGTAYDENEIEFIKTMTSK